MLCSPRVSTGACGELFVCDHEPLGTSTKASSRISKHEYFIPIPPSNYESSLGPGGENRRVTLASVGERDSFDWSVMQDADCWMTNQTIRATTQIIRRPPTR